MHDFEKGLFSLFSLLQKKNLFQPPNPNAPFPANLLNLFKLFPLILEIFTILSRIQPSFHYDFCNSSISFFKSLMVFSFFDLRFFFFNFLWILIHDNMMMRNPLNLQSIIATTPFLLSSFSNERSQIISSAHHNITQLRNLSERKT